MGASKKPVIAFIAAVWLINGLFCKLLNLVPRHQQIVARILGEGHSVLFTKAIGCLEVLMAVWVISRVGHRLCTFTQIIVVAAMNVMEFFLAPDLLLFGRANLVVATVFVLFLGWHEGLLKRRTSAATFTS